MKSNKRSPRPNFKAEIQRESLVIRYTQITNHIDCLPDTNLNINMKKHYRSTNKSNTHVLTIQILYADSNGIANKLISLMAATELHNIYIMAIMETKVKTVNPLALRRQTCSLKDR